MQPLIFIRTVKKNLTLRVLIKHLVFIIDEHLSL